MFISPIILARRRCKVLGDNNKYSPTQISSILPLAPLPTKFQKNPIRSTLLLLIPLILLLDYNCQQLNLPRINCLHISNDTHRRHERSHKFERYVSTRQIHFC